MIFFTKGAFDMGDWGPEVNPGGLAFDSATNSKPLHKVQLDAFAISKFPVTYKQFDLFTAAVRLPRINQEKIAQKYRKPDYPAGVTWQGAKDYCAWLGQQANLKMDLPTEAQWEYAARSGGKRHLYATNNGRFEAGRNVPSFADRQSHGGLVAIDSYPPNPAGIHYMGMLVREWVLDWYGERYYETSPELNPTGPSQGSEHVVRGFLGSDTSAMTFQRWAGKDDGQVGSWTAYSGAPTFSKKQIPYTKYSSSRDSAFRCVVKTDKPL
ncbi:formylglycine-generating enzyme family protein [Duganella callida]|nr:SUMF1/EgtB/PvdO family nonheme iron enzyme [Duganella callida]